MKNINILANKTQTEILKKELEQLSEKFDLEFNSDKKLLEFFDFNVKFIGSIKYPVAKIPYKLAVWLKDNCIYSADIIEYSVSSYIGNEDYKIFKKQHNRKIKKATKIKLIKKCKNNDKYKMRDGSLLIRLYDINQINEIPTYKYYNYEQDFIYYPNEDCYEFISNNLTLDYEIRRKEYNCVKENALYFCKKIKSVKAFMRYLLTLGYPSGMSLYCETDKEKMLFRLK